MEAKFTTREIPFGTEYHEEEIRLRQKILRDPLGLRYTEEQLAAEKDELHLGLYETGKLCGCVLLKHVDSVTAQMRQFAVDTPLQGKGAGRILAQEFERVARERGYSTIILHAREVVLPFYEKLGYEVISESYTEVGIPHRTMKKML